MKCYRDLTVWREGIDVVADIYVITKKFPNDERYALCDQTQRVLAFFVYFFRVVGRIGNAPDHCKQTVLRN